MTFYKESLPKKPAYLSQIGLKLFAQDAICVKGNVKNKEKKQSLFAFFVFNMRTHMCFICVRPCVRVYMLMPTCVYAGVRAYPPVCVCTLLGSARELTGAEKTPIVAEETDIDAEEANQVAAGEEMNLNRGVTDLDATAKTSDLNHSENTVNRSVKYMEVGYFL